MQSDFSDYMASLGPWDAETVTEYLRDEYPTLAPPAALQVSALLQSDAELATLTFAERVAKERDTYIDASEVIRGLRAKLAAAKSSSSACMEGITEHWNTADSTAPPNQPE